MKAIIIILALILIHQRGFTQNSSDKQVRSKKIGIGGFLYDSNTYLINGSFNKTLKNKNELVFPIYFISDDLTMEVSASLAYFWATSKKQHRFNFHLGPELNLNYTWYPPKPNYHLPVSRYGSFFCVGFVPSYRISTRLLLAFELKFGYGYQWVENDEVHFIRYFHLNEYGWYYRFLPSFKVFYSF